ncbi:HNH endonuclease signature motif containing protein [Pseudomonas fluorescens group sp. PF-1]
MVYPGSPTIPVLPPIETFPAVDEAEIGASIPGFPGDMELPSPDALFRDRRDDPGVATGMGKAVSGGWLGEAARGQGAPIPSQIADQLRLREFRNFHGFRRAFWMAVAADAQVRSQFTPIDLHLMKKGNAPYASTNDRNGGRTKCEIHHLDEVAKGGAVYDVDNLVVMTPKRHIDFHGQGN